MSKFLENKDEIDPTREYKDPNFVTLKVQIWDMANKSAMSLYPYFLMDVHGILVAYDITSKESFEFALETLKEIFYMNTENFKVVLIGNKVDKRDQRVIPFEEGLKVAIKYDIFFFETSAKDNIAIRSLFDIFMDYETIEPLW